MINKLNFLCPNCEEKTIGVNDKIKLGFSKKARFVCGHCDEEVIVNGSYRSLVIKSWDVLMGPVFFFSMIFFVSLDIEPFGLSLILGVVFVVLIYVLIFLLAPLSLREFK